MQARILALAAALLVPAFVPAQPPTLQTLEVPLGLASGSTQNPTRVAATVWTGTVSLQDVSSFRLRFGMVELNDPRDAVVVTNVLDGQIQRLDRNALRQWRNLTGWFNGASAVVGLDLAPGSSGSVQVIGAVAFSGAPAMPESLCEGDSRVASFDSRVFRLLLPGLPGGTGICTGFLINDRATYVTAGHCFSGLTDLTTVAEFNVPPSTASGAIVHPSINNQFPGDPTTIQFDDDTPEHDWAVGRLHPNGSGENASAVHGFVSLNPGSPLNFNGLVIGYGADTSPLTRNFTQQSDSGSVDSPQFGSELRHHSDTQDGSSGSPLFNLSTNQVAGIHVEGGCDGAFIPLPGVSLPHNSATRVSDSGLVAAIAAVGGCDGIHLENGDAATVFCSPTIFSCDHQQSHWNVVGVSSPADWDIVRENVGSTINGNICDFLISNGHVGSVPPISGEIRRISNFSPATAQFVVAAPLQIDQTLATTWSAGRILRAFEIPVPATSVGRNFNITLAGDPSLRWHLYRPDLASGSPWFPRNAGLHSAGVVSGGTVTSPITVSGTWCLVIYRDGGPDVPTIPTLGITVADGSTVPLPLAANTPANIGPGTPSFSLTPAAGSWNAVGVTAPTDTSLLLATGVSVTPNFAAEFVVANGRAGAITQTAGLVTQANPPASMIEHALPVPAATNTLITSNIPAGHVLRLLDVTVAATNSYQIVVTGDPSLRWALYSPTNGTQWLGPEEALASGQVLGPPAARNLPAGSYALVVARNGGVAATDTGFQARIGLQTGVLNLTGPGSSIGNLAGSDFGFTCVPEPVRWNAVGSFGSLASGQTILIGGASSATTTFGTGFVVANAHISPITQTGGILTHFGPAGANIFQAACTPMNVGTLGSVNWTPSMTMHLFEFNVPAAGVFNLSVVGSGGLGWMLFRPGTSSAWRPRSDGELVSSVGTAQNGVSLQTGYHAIAVFRGGINPLPSGAITCSVTFAGNQAPVLTSVSPTSAVGGLASATVILTGSGILLGCQVEWDGAILSGGIGTLGFFTSSVPASVLAVPGNHTLRLVNPPPGGGPSAPLAFTVRPPRIASVSPANVAVIPAGGAPVQLTIDGADFLSGAVVHAGGRVLPTTFVNSGRLLATIDGAVAETNAAGAAALTVENGHRAQSNTVALPVGPGGSNHGTAVRYPLNPFPGEAYVARLEGGPPGGLLTWLVDFASPAPVTNWPSAAVNLVIGIGTPGTTFALVDGFGLLGPANTAAVYGFDPNGTAPGGTFTVPGFVWPQTPLNVRLSMQTVDLDPSQPLGFGLGWTRIEDL